MNIYNLEKDIRINPHDNPAWFTDENNYFIICETTEVEYLQPIFAFDEGTIEECLRYDENIRFDTFENYDFISLNFFDFLDNQLVLEELNIYVGKNYIILVGEQESKIVVEIMKFVMNKLKMNSNYESIMNRVYFWIFDQIINGLFISLEKMEDRLQELEGEILKHVERKQFIEISKMREQINKGKKYLRPLLYIGEQISVNENNFINKKNLRYFRSIDVRLNKLYDFIVSLKEVGDQLVYLYDSSLASETNEIVTRLTTLAIFFGPLTVITGIYGMNFKYMPELELIYGYPLVLAFMALLTTTLYIIFKKKKWL